MKALSVTTGLTVATNSFHLQSSTFPCVRSGTHAAASHPISLVTSFASRLWGWRHEHPEAASTLQAGTGAPKAAALDTLPTQGQAALATLPQGPGSHPAQLREQEEGRRDHSKGVEKKKLSVKPGLGPSSRWLSSSEESSDRKTA